jgi:ubiquinone biosynthesis protein UbiJ
VSEYLQEESRITPTKIEVERFLNAVDALDADIERLEARTSRLMQACKQ